MNYELNHPFVSPPSLSYSEKERRRHARVLNVEPEVGPGGIFKIPFLGTHDFPLCDEEYGRRQGSRFTEETAAIVLVNPLNSRENVQIEFISRYQDLPAAVVLLRPGRRIWLPILLDFTYRALAINTEFKCAAK